MGTAFPGPCLLRAWPGVSPPWPACPPVWLSGCSVPASPSPEAELAASVVMLGRVRARRASRRPSGVPAPARAGAPCAAQPVGGVPPGRRQLPVPETGLGLATESLDQGVGRAPRHWLPSTPGYPGDRRRPLFPGPPWGRALWGSVPPLLPAAVADPLRSASHSEAQHGRPCVLLTCPPCDPGAPGPVASASGCLRRPRDGAVGSCAPRERGACLAA